MEVTSVLVSHRKRFIYLKTEKTAGTSVETFFEPYCFPEGAWTESLRRDATVGPEGIVGRRAFGRTEVGAEPPAWFNHMPAAQIRAQLGNDVWASYFKFANIRNPFDKLVSAFHMLKANAAQEPALFRFRRRIAGLRGRGQPLDRARGRSEIEQFRGWVSHGGHMNDRDAYVIDGEVCVDYFIRYEHLNEDVLHVCELLGVASGQMALPRHRTDTRHHRIPVRDYYDGATERTVRKRYALEFELFGYEMPCADVC